MASPFKIMKHIRFSSMSCSQLLSTLYVHTPGNFHVNKIGYHVNKISNQQLSHIKHQYMEHFHKGNWKIGYHFVSTDRKIKSKILGQTIMII